MVEIAPNVPNFNLEIATTPSQLLKGLRKDRASCFRLWIVRPKDLEYANDACALVEYAFDAIDQPPHSQGYPQTPVVSCVPQRSGKIIATQTSPLEYSLDRMSALGQKQTCAAHTPMSAKVPIADIRPLFDHFIGAQ